MVDALLYEMQSSRNCFTLSLSGSDSLRGNSWRDDNDATMVIMTVLRRWRSQAQDDDGHIISLILIACDVYVLCILFCLDRR